MLHSGFIATDPNGQLRRVDGLSLILMVQFHLVLIRLQLKELLEMLMVISYVVT